MRCFIYQHHMTSLRKVQSCAMKFPTRLNIIQLAKAFLENSCCKFDKTFQVEVGPIVRLVKANIYASEDKTNTNSSSCSHLISATCASLGLETLSQECKYRNARLRTMPLLNTPCCSEKFALGKLWQTSTQTNLIWRSL